MRDVFKAMALGGLFGIILGVGFLYSMAFAG